MSEVSRRPIELDPFQIQIGIFNAKTHESAHLSC